MRHIHPKDAPLFNGADLTVRPGMKFPPPAEVRKALGATFDPAKDGKRLETALDRVRAFMSDGEWRTLPDIAAACGCTEAGASARLRELRGLGVAVKSERVSGGLWRYAIASAALAASAAGAMVREGE